MNRNRQRSFSLVELVIVIVIIGIIAAIAVPRLSMGSQSAREVALKQNLTVLRKAIDYCAADHDGVFPPAADINQILRRRSKLDYTLAPGDPDNIYGPYLKTLPALPVGSRAGSKLISHANGANVGWIYDETTGDVRANTVASEKDSSGGCYWEY